MSKTPSSHNSPDERGSFHNQSVIRLLAESAILRYIGELTGDNEKNLLEVNRTCFPELDAIAEFEVLASVTVDQIETIRRLWIAEKSLAKGRSATQFACDLAKVAFMPEIELPEPNE